MKKKIHKIWGVGLVLVLATTMLLFPVPASADTLAWDDVDIPEELLTMEGILDIAVAEGGAVIYAVSGNETLYVSTNTGESWGEATVTVDDVDIDAKFVAVSPDDSEYIAAANTTGTVYISDDSGATWDTLGDSTVDNVADIAVSAESGGNRWIAVAGDDGANARVVYYEIGAIGAAWTEASAEDGFYGGSTAGAVAFSPNFASDEILTAVTGVPQGSLDTSGDGTAEWSTTQAHSGRYSALLDAVSTDANEARVVIELPTPIAVEDLDTFSYQVYATEGAPAHVDFYVDVNGDGEWVAADDDILTLDPWQWPDIYEAKAWGGQGLPQGIEGTATNRDPQTLPWYPQGGFRGMPEWDVAQGTLQWLQVSLDITDDGTVVRANDAVFGSQAMDDVLLPWYYWQAGVASGTIDDPDLAFTGDRGDFDFNPTDIRPTDVILRIEIEFDGWGWISTGYVDDITINGTSYDLETDINFQMFSFNKNKWNSAADFTDFPVAVVEDSDDAVVDALDSASISLSRDYLGSDDDMRVAFVGITTLGTDSGDEADGIFRLDNDDVEVLEDEENMHSVDFDGANLVAGGYDDTTVYRSDDPLSSSPDVSSSASLKSPGGEELTVVAFADDSVVAGTYGNESSFSVSRDSGETFNDISLIDTTLDTLSDVAVSADGSVIYLVTAQTSSNDMSLWRYAGDVWERVLSVQGASANYIVRLAPDDTDVIYLAEVGSTTIYYSDSAGLDRWRPRTSTETIVDLAVETEGDVSYVLTTSGYVSESTNHCFTWGGKESTGQSGSNMIVSLGEDLVLVGGEEATPAVSYSTDGNESWTDLDDLDDEGLVQVIASGLDDGDFIYAATSGGGAIYRWELGEDDSWDDFYDEVATDDAITGLALSEDGVLYAVAYNEASDNSTLYRFLDPTDGDVSIEAASLVDVELSNTPSALRVSAGSAVLWAIGVDTGDNDAQKLYSYEDTIALVGPTLKGPKNGFVVPINVISGEPADVSFSWECPSDEITDWNFEIAFDEDFDAKVADEDVDEEADEGDLVSFVVDDEICSVMPDTTYYWRVKVTDPVESPWSDTWSFTVVEAEGVPPVTIAPTPEITVSVPPAPQVVLPAPEIIIPTPEIVLPAPQVTLPPSPAPVAPIPGWALYVIIIIGAVLVLALIVLILRTRRPV